VGGDSWPIALLDNQFGPATLRLGTQKRQSVALGIGGKPSQFPDRAESVTPYKYIATV
jgi:hypothetical protein